MTDFYLKSKSKEALDELVKGLMFITPVAQGRDSIDLDTRVVTPIGDPEFWYVGIRTGFIGFDLPEGILECDPIEGQIVAGLIA